MNKIFAVVVTYNGMKWIDRCITSLQTSSVDLQIIVIDNCSEDNTVRWIKENKPNVEIIENTINVGFGLANNIGLKKSLGIGAEYVFLLNQDAWVEPDAIKYLIECAQNYPAFGIISPFHLNGDGDKLDIGFNYYFTRELQKNRTLCSNFYWQKDLDRPYHIDFVNAAGWLLTYDALKQVGGFDPLFNHWGEDNNYIDRLNFKKLKLGICAKSIMYHDREDSFANRNKFNSDVYYRSILIDLLNPNKDIAIYKTKRKILINAWKSFSRRRFSEMDNIVKVYFRISKIKNSIHSSRTRYKSDFCFLDDKMTNENG